jgi:hypothetical protein
MAEYHLKDEMYGNDANNRNFPQSKQCNADVAYVRNLCIARGGPCRGIRRAIRFVEGFQIATSD